MKPHFFFLSLVLGQLAVMVSAAGGSTMDHPTQADTAKECSICHYRWVYTLYIEHCATPIAPLQEGKVEGEQRMCLSCHDGSVLDSRDRICNDPGHRVGVKPSSKVRLPETFPLDERGGLLCVTCHTPHALAATAPAVGPLYLAVGVALVVGSVEIWHAWRDHPL